MYRSYLRTVQADTMHVRTHRLQTSANHTPILPSHDEWRLSECHHPWITDEGDSPAWYG